MVPERSFDTGLRSWAKSAWASSNLLSMTWLLTCTLYKPCFVLLVLSEKQLVSSACMIWCIHNPVVWVTEWFSAKLLTGISGMPMILAWKVTVATLTIRATFWKPANVWSKKEKSLDVLSSNTKIMITCLTGISVIDMTNSNTNEMHGKGACGQKCYKWKTCRTDVHEQYNPQTRSGARRISYVRPNPGSLILQHSMQHGKLAYYMHQQKLLLRLIMP